jgi:hypothetical protein
MKGPGSADPALPRDRLSLAGLILANLVPLVGVFAWGWDATMLVLLYWTENLIVGFYAILRIALLPVKQRVEQFGKLLAIPFFCIHFGGFCAVHGLFLLLFFKIGKGPLMETPHGAWPGPLIFLQFLFGVIAQLWRCHPPGMEWPVLALAVSHGVSFVQNYLAGQERAATSMRTLMERPYQRIMLLHVAILLGAVPTLALGSPLPMVLLLIGIKIVIDLRMHTKSRRKAAAKRLPGSRQSAETPADQRPAATGT